MILPELPKVRERQEMLHRSRRYFLKASECYAYLRQQKGFALVPGHKLRAALREHLTHKEWGRGQTYIAKPGRSHRPECDIRMENGIWGSFQRDDAQELGWGFVERYSYQCLQAIAGFMPFCCPVCAGDENPLRYEHRLPHYPNQQQLICLTCWEKWKGFCNQPFHELDDLIKDLNREITNAQKRKSQRRKADQQLGDSHAEGNVRHPGPEAVAHPSL